VDEGIDYVKKLNNSTRPHIELMELINLKQLKFVYKKHGEWMHLRSN
jgi:DNA mismatch repair protein MutH